MHTTPAAAIGAVAGLLLLVVACGTPDPAAAPDVSAQPAPALPASSTRDLPSLPADSPAPRAAPSEWTMPDLTGVTLQDAQDAVQALTGYGIAITTSTDATGAGRLQVSDGNWRVCAQNVPPGAAITSDTEIDFAVVKLEESC